MPKKIVLAYSGGLDTSVILKWLQLNYDCPVATYTADIGQNDNFDEIKSKAENLGVKEICIEDLKEEFVKDYVFPMFRANALYEGYYLLGTAIARPLIARKQVEYAIKIGADAVAHGSTGKGNDQVRFEIGYYATDPDIKIIDISKWQYDGWWNKMLLFHPEIDKEGTNLYLDLDLTIQKDITDIDKFIFPQLLTSVYCFWKPINWLELDKQTKEVQEDRDMRFPTFYNSSIMGWVGHTLHKIWRDFYKDDQFIMTQYRGNDDYLGNEWNHLLKPLPK